MTVKEWPQRYNLSVWQSEFAQKYLEQHKPKSLLVAAPGTGKTITALYTARLMREQNLSDSLIVLNDISALREQWKHVASEVGFNLSSTIEQYRKAEHDGLSITVQSLNDDDRIGKL